MCVPFHSILNSEVKKNSYNYYDILIAYTINIWFKLIIPNEIKRFYNKSMFQDYLLVYIFNVLGVKGHICHQLLLC